MKKWTFFWLFLLTLASYANAQEEALPDVGLGATRDTLAYMVGNPQKIATLAGFKEGNFFWEVDIKAAAKQAEKQVQESEQQLKSIKEMSEEDLPAQEREEMISEAEYYVERAKANLASTKGTIALIDIFRKAIETSTRVDLCIVDITTGGPKMYLDMHLADGISVDLSNESIKEMMTVAEIDLNGISAYRYGGDMLPAPITAFERNGHLYVAMFNEVAENLARGLVKPRMDGESLAESSRFQKWYKMPRAHELEIWINAHQFRRLVESTEGLVPGGFSDLVKEINSELGLRHWELFTIGLDHDPETASFKATLSIKTRRDNKAFTTIPSDNLDLALLSFMPADSPIAGFGNLNSPLTLWETYKPIVERTFAAIDREEAAQRKREEEWKKEYKEDSKPRDGEDRPVRQMPPPEAEKEQESSYQRFIESMNRITKPAGKSFEEALGLLSGRFAFANTPPKMGKDGHGPTTLIAIGCKNGADTQSALSTMANKFIAEERRGTRLLVEGEAHYFLINGTWMHVVEDVLLVTECRGAEQHALAALKKMKVKEGGRGSFTNAVAGFRIDIYRMMKEQEDMQVSQERRLSRDIGIRTPGNLAERFPMGLHLKIGVHTAPRELRFTIDFQGAFTDERITSLFGPDQNTHNYVAEGALRNAFRELQSLEVMPANAAALVEAGFFKGYLQSPFDSNFEGTIGGWGYPYRHGEFQEAWDEEMAKGIEAIKANLKKDFLSYELAPMHGRKIGNMGGRILLYQTKAETYGGRVILYGNGNIGWLHESVWPKAEALMKEGKQIPSDYDWDEDDSMPDEGGMDDDGVKKEYKAGNQAPRVIDADDTENKAALSVVKLYAEGTQKAPSVFKLHDNAKAGQSSTYTTTNSVSKTENKVTYSVVKTDADKHVALVEIDYHKRYVISLLVSTNEKIAGYNKVHKAWAGVKGMYASKAKMHDLPTDTSAESHEAPEGYSKTSESFEKLKFAGKEFSGTKTTYVINKTGETAVSTWKSENAYFVGVLKNVYGNTTMLLSATSSNASATLLYPENVLEVPQKVEAKKSE